MSRIIIRHACEDDIEQLSRIEAASYPPLEGASEKSIRARVDTFPECFWILEEDGIIKAFINGMVTDEENLSDEMYDNARMHHPDGKWQMIFSVVTAPDARENGYASMLMKQVIEDSKSRRKGVVLTCKEQLLGFYEQFGFVSEGISDSTHGDVMWYQMRIAF